MSCIQLSEKHIAAVAHGLAFILNGPDEFPAMPQIFPRLLHLLDWDAGRYTIDRDFYAFTKLLDSFIYQCNEDATRNNPVLKALSGTSRALYAFIVQNAAEYNSAEWII